MSRVYRAHFDRLIVHKWHVFLECLRHGILLEGILHDLSKFLPSEFKRYAKYFLYLDNDDLDDFKDAVRLHKSRNAHHWEFWTNGRKEVEDESVIPEMDHRSRMEMICDWRGFASDHGHVDTAEEYYLNNMSSIKLNPVTRSWVEQELGIERALKNERNQR